MLEIEAAPGSVEEVLVPAKHVMIEAGTGTVEEVKG